jgi:hypothetical protein
MLGMRQSLGEMAIEGSKIGSRGEAFGRQFICSNPRFSAPFASPLQRQKSKTRAVLGSGGKVVGIIHELSRQLYLLPSVLEIVGIFS